MGSISESHLCSPSDPLWGLKADQSGLRREQFNTEGKTAKSVENYTHEIVIISWMFEKKTENN